MITLLVLLASALFHSTFACGGILTTVYGFIGYTDLEVSCNWTIRGSDTGSIISVLFLSSSIQSCNKMYIQIFNETGPLTEELCGNLNQRLNFHTDMLIFKYVFLSGSNRYHKFNFAYFIDDPNAQCGGLLTENTGTLSPPTENGLMLNNVDCVWFIAARLSRDVLLYFTHMQLEFHGSCEDRVQVKELFRDGTFGPVRSYCGAKAPKPRWYGSLLVVMFSSDNDNPFTGFTARFEVQYSVDREVLPLGLGTIDISRDGELLHMEKKWHIIGDVGHRLKLIFKRVSLDQSDGCETEYIEFYDGKQLWNSNENILLKSCAFDVGSVVDIPYNSVTIIYYMSRRSRGNGFSLTYYMGNGTCGGLFGAPTGNLNFPSTGGSYDNMMSCEWGFVGLPQETVTFDVLTNDMDDNCTFDSLKIYDIMESSSPMVLEVCSNITGTAVSTGHELHSIFQSDVSDTYNGFTAQWKIGYEGCGGVFAQLSGTFTSDDRVPSEALHCEWLIFATSDGYIEVNFTNFDLLGNAECDEDYVEIRNGDTPDSPLILRTCDFDTTRTFLSISNMLYIIYHSSTSSNRTGVSASFNVVRMTCGPTVSDPSGVFHMSAGSEKCIWVIGGTPESATTLLFESFNLQSSVDCYDEYIEVRDGNGTLILRACGTEIPSIIHGSRRNPLIVTFRSYINSMATFTAVFLTSGLDCGSLEISDHGKINPPRENGNYHLNRFCPWLIHGQPGQRVLFYVGHLDISGGPVCEDELLAVYDGWNISSPLVYETCLTHGKPAPFTSTGRSLLVIFKSSSYLYKIRKLGFTGYYDIFYEPLEKGISTSATNMISASRHGSSGVIHREWNIIGAPGDTFKMGFTKFFLDTIHDCNVDYFEIRNGTYASSPLIERSCDFNVRTIYEYNIFEAYIIFHSETTSRGDGLTLGYQMGNCGGLFVSQIGSIAFPENGGNYGTFQHCGWLFMGMEHEAIVFNVLTMHLEGCDYDNLTVYDGASDQDPVLGVFCDVSTGIVESSNNTLAMVMLSDYQMEYSGFTGKWMIEYDGCGNVFTNLSGDFSSDNKTENEDLRCEWHIIGKFDTFIELNFTKYDLDPNCDQDYVEIRNDTSVYKLCSNSTERSFVSVTSSVSIVYHSSQTSGATGISVSYIINESATSATPEESTAEETPVSKDDKTGHSSKKGSNQVVEVNVKQVVRFPQGQDTIYG